jgi:hypothetical protein
MSLVEELGARVRGTAEELPVGSVVVAAERLRVGLELLQWVRRESVHEVGVVHLANAIEQLEAVALAVRTAQDGLADYLRAIGMAYDAAPTPDRSWRESLAPPAQPVSKSETEVDATPLGRWWSARVDELTGEPGGGTAPGRGEPGHGEPGHDGPGGAARGRGELGGAGHGEADRRGAVTDPAELLRRVAGPVRSADRHGLRGELRRVEAPVGLGLAAITPPVARHLVTDLLGHEPGAADLPELTKRCAPQVRNMLPGVPEHVLPALLARVCRAQPPQPARRSEQPKPAPGRGSGGAGGTGAAGGSAGRSGGEPEPTHPTDPAVTGAVLVGVLLQKLGRDPDTLRGAEHVDG